jgi:hypothetical protein
MAAPIHRISNESFDMLIAIMETFMELSFKFKAALRLVLFETVYEKDATILNFGDTQGIVWFLLDGLFREVRVNKMTLKAITSWFWLPNDFSYTDPGFFSQQPSARAIHVLERTKVVLISYQDWFALKEAFREGEALTEILRGGYSKSRVEHLLDMKNLTVDERYLDKEKILDYLFPRTQLNYIADYMGMASDTLGKLRTKYYGRKR